MKRALQLGAVGPRPPGYDSEGAGRAVGVTTGAARASAPPSSPRWPPPGRNLDALTIDDLAPSDQFHGGGKDATVRLARLAALAPGMRVLDAGGGVGGRRAPWPSSSAAASPRST